MLSHTGHRQRSKVSIAGTHVTWTIEHLAGGSNRLQVRVVVITIVFGSVIQKIVFTPKLSKFTAAAVVISIVAVVLGIVGDMGCSAEVVGALELLQDV